MNECEEVKVENYGSVPSWVQEEIRCTWRAATECGNQRDSFNVLERMVDRIGYGRLKDNPPLTKISSGRIDHVEIA